MGRVEREEVMQAHGLQLALLSYLVSAGLFVFASAFKNAALERPADIFFRVGFLFHTLLVGFRWHEAGRPPFANMYEALVLMAWCIALVYVVFSLSGRVRFLGKAVSVLLLLMMNFIATLDSTITPLMPALQSRWISIHVVTYFIGYGGLTLSFVCGLYYLFARRAERPLAPSLDLLGYRFIAFAFPFLTIGMTTGSVWANAAWGTYWSWDPKETCSLITWLVYALYLHLRVFRGWKESKAAYLSIFGYLAVLFTFVGVNFILPGLHSYAS
ncbi:MAG: cytochrome c biogenesis protein CcsA [Deltaproteobacteria bacterium]